MKITGGTVLHAPIGAVWTALNDPAVLVQTIPGCERLTATAGNTYELTVTAGVGTITGTYTGEIALTDQQPPGALTLRASGSGSPGTVATTVLVQLAENEGGTAVSYDADATIGGMIAGVGQRMLAAAARRQATQFFTALDGLLLAQAAVGEEATGQAGAVSYAVEPGQGRRFAGAAGVASPKGAATRGASGMTWERPAADRQPAGLRAAGPPTEGSLPGASGMTWERPAAAGQPAGRLRARPPTAGFMQGAITGAAIALAGVVVGGLIARRKR